MLPISRQFILGGGLTLAVLMPICVHAKSSETVLHIFTRGNDGAYPFASLIADKQGNLYSTTPYGGPNDSGTVFQVAQDGTEAVLYTFTGGSDGGTPQGGLIMNPKGSLYGTTVNGGTDGRGAVFEYASKSGAETVLYSFTGGADGANPWAALIAVKDDFYGTTIGGGADNNNGALFKLAPDGTETVLHSFGAGNDGVIPYADLIADTKGNLYGTTVGGGDYGSGVVFKVTPKGKESVLYSFCAQSNCADGENPTSGLLMDNSGNLYGMTTKGGNASDDGIVFKLAADGAETVLHSFCTKTNCTDGATPNAVPIMDKKGNLYGTTTAGGADNDGTVFELAPDGTETVLHAFTGGTDGDYPAAGLLMNKKGNLYGTTRNGGGNSNCGEGCGTVFEVTK